MQTGCYSLDLYCDVQTPHPYKAFPVTYVAERGPTCRSHARRSGWILKRDGRAICPSCAAKGLRLEDGKDYMDYGIAVYERHLVEHARKSSEGHEDD
jgi:hypothetical protein